MTTATGDSRLRCPVGIQIIAYMHIAVGALAALSALLGTVLGIVFGRGQVGLRLEGLVALAVPLALGPALGLGLLKGRPWAWFLGHLCYLFGVLSGMIVLGATETISDLFGVEGADLATHLLFTVLYCGTALLGIATFIAAYAYFFRFNVRRWFGQDRLPIWKVGLAQFAVVLAVTVPGGLVLRGGFEARTMSQLTIMGEHPTTGESEVRFMLEQLKHGGPEVRAVAAWALGRSGRLDVAPALLRAVREDSDDLVRANAVASLAQVGGEDIGEVLVDFLTNESEVVRGAVLQILAKETRIDAIVPVGRVLLDDSPALRAAAADVLGRIGGTEAVPVLVRAATDPEADVRSRVAFALGKIGDPNGVPALIDLLDDEIWEVRANAAQALGMIGDPSVYPELEPLLNDPNPQVKWATAAAVEKLR